MAKPASRITEDLRELALKAKTDFAARAELFNHLKFKQMANSVSAILFAHFGQVGDILTPEDIKSLLLNKLLKAVEKYEGRASLRAYLFIIGTRLYQDEFRRVKREKVAIESYLKGRIQFLSERSITQRALVSCAVGRLTPEEADLFKLYLERKPKSQIAKEVKKSLSQVYRDLDALFDKLVKEIETELDSEPAHTFTRA